MKSQIGDVNASAESSGNLSFFLSFSSQINHPKYNQRRVSAVKYLGELYNYRMVESVVIFKTLYSFISFGVSLDGKYCMSCRQNQVRGCLTQKLGFLPSFICI